MNSQIKQEIITEISSTATKTIEQAVRDRKGLFLKNFSIKRPTKQ